MHHRANQIYGRIVNQRRPAHCCAYQARPKGRQVACYSKIRSTSNARRKPLQITISPTTFPIGKPRRLFVRLMRGLLWAVALLIGLVVLGVGYEAVMASGDATRYPPPGRLV